MVRSGRCRRRPAELIQQVAEATVQLVFEPPLDGRRRKALTGSLLAG